MAVIVRITDEAAAGPLASRAEARLPYTEPMPELRWSGYRTDVGVVLLPAPSASGRFTVSYLCLASKGRKISTRHAQMKLTDLRPLGKPLALGHWLEGMPDQTAQHLRKSVEETGREIPDQTWQDAKQTLARLRPETATLLSELYILLRPETDLSPAEAEVLAEQKDAVGVALQAAGLERQIIGLWQPSPRRDGQVAPFLSGLAPGTIREDTMVIHDASRLPGWWPAGEPYVGTSQFADNNGRTLTVMNVNRHRIEEVTGVDLLYYQHEAHSFTMVQYKRLSPSPEAVFRPSSDRNNLSELERMRSIDQQSDGEQTEAGSDTTEAGSDTTDPSWRFRLHSGTCWLKLCRSEGFVPANNELVRGMYLPLAFYDELVLQSRFLFA